MSKYVLKGATQKLQELENAMAHIAGEFTKLHGGDESCLPIIAVHLRSLVAMSSNMDGLLWRLCKELSVDDVVMARGALNPKPFPQLADAVAMFKTASDTEQPAQVSLLHSIKTAPIAVGAGKPLTAEVIVKALADNIGPAHLSDRVGKELLAMVQLQTNGYTNLVCVFHEIAHYTLIVGDRVLEAAELIGFTRRRPRAHVELTPPHDLVFNHKLTFPEVQVVQEGYVEFGLEIRPNLTIAQSYPDQSAASGLVRLQGVTLLADGRLYGWVYWFGKAHFFIRLVPLDAPYVGLGVAWTKAEIKVGVATVPPHLDL